MILFLNIKNIFSLLKFPRRETEDINDIVGVDAICAPAQLIFLFGRTLIIV